MIAHPPIPLGSIVSKNGRYLIIEVLHNHPIAGTRGRVPLHRFVCFEAIGRPTHSACRWCGFVMPWKTNVGGYQWAVVCVDHLDGDPENNLADNLAPSCAWCNANRNWAEKHAIFWANWRRWLADVPPVFRPNLPKIAADFGINSGLTDTDKSTDISTDMSVNGHTDKRPYTIGPRLSVTQRDRTTNNGQPQ